MKVPTDEAEVLRGYAADARELIPNFEGISTLDVLAPVAELLPSAPVRILDVGAGTGRDAAWFAGRGHRVTAVEPVRELREIGRGLHPSPNIRWVDDRLPDLERVRAIGEKYDAVILVAVWQHLRPRDRTAALRTLAALAAPSGRLFLSIRHGPGSPKRPCFPASPERVIAGAEALGLALARRRRAPSLQQKNRDAGVTWTWLCFESP